MGHGFHAGVWIVGVLQLPVDRIIFGAFRQVRIAIVIVTSQTPLLGELGLGQGRRIILFDVGNHFLDLLLDGRLVAVETGYACLAMSVGREIRPVPGSSWVIKSALALLGGAPSGWLT